MKISQFQTVSELRRDILLPVSINGKNLKITLGQIIDNAPKGFALFDNIQPRPTAVSVVEGSDSLNPKSIIYDPFDRRFYMSVHNIAGGAGAIVESWTYYRNWKGVSDFMDSTGAVRKDAVFGDKEGRFYIFNGTTLVRAGMTEAEAAALDSAVWIKVDSEEAMDTLIKSGAAADGKIRYILEEE